VAGMADSRTASGTGLPASAGQRAADVFVVFGITGDPEEVMTFRSLYRLERRGLLLHAAMVGQSTRFTRQDGVEEAWRITQPLLDAPPPVHGYTPGSWGPAAAEELVATHGGWHGPWMPS
jgi:glucose-6-phosphate 1-dehydrogenase